MGTRIETNYSVAPTESVENIERIVDALRRKILITKEHFSIRARHSKKSKTIMDRLSLQLDQFLETIDESPANQTVVDRVAMELNTIVSDNEYQEMIREHNGWVVQIEESKERYRAVEKALDDIINDTSAVTKELAIDATDTPHTTEQQLLLRLKKKFQAIAWTEATVNTFIVNRLAGEKLETSLQRYERCAERLLADCHQYIELVKKLRTDPLAVESIERVIDPADTPDKNIEIVDVDDASLRTDEAPTDVGELPALQIESLQKELRQVEALLQSKGWHTEVPWRMEQLKKRRGALREKIAAYSIDESTDNPHQTVVVATTDSTDTWPQSSIGRENLDTETTTDQEIAVNEDLALKVNPEKIEDVVSDVAVVAPAMPPTREVLAKKYPHLFGDRYGWINKKRESIETVSPETITKTAVTKSVLSPEGWRVGRVGREETKTETTVDSRVLSQQQMIDTLRVAEERFRHDAKRINGSIQRGNHLEVSENEFLATLKNAKRQYPHDLSIQFIEDQYNRTANQLKARSWRRLVPTFFTRKQFLAATLALWPTAVNLDEPQSIINQPSITHDQTISIVDTDPVVVGDVPATLISPVIEALDVRLEPFTESTDTATIIDSLPNISIPMEEPNVVSHTPDASITQTMPTLLSQQNVIDVPVADTNTESMTPGFGVLTITKGMWVERELRHALDVIAPTITGSVREGIINEEIARLTTDASWLETSGFIHGDWDVTEPGEVVDITELYTAIKNRLETAERLKVSGSGHTALTEMPVVAEKFSDADVMEAVIGVAPNMFNPMRAEYEQKQEQYNRLLNDYSVRNVTDIALMGPTERVTELGIHQFDPDLFDTFYTAVVITARTAGLHITDDMPMREVIALLVTHTNQTAKEAS